MKHKCEECETALIRLLDELCSWERDTGRGSTLLLIPHNEDEEIIMAQDGKPIPNDTPLVSPQGLLNLAMKWRYESTQR
jgi:hypothetical protein